MPGKTTVFTGLCTGIAVLHKNRNTLQWRLVGIGYLAVNALFACLCQAMSGINKQGKNNQQAKK
jgi:hypothetical protein